MGTSREEPTAPTAQVVLGESNTRFPPLSAKSPKSDRSADMRVLAGLALPSSARRAGPETTRPDLARARGRAPGAQGLWGWCLGSDGGEGDIRWQQPSRAFTLSGVDGPIAQGRVLSVNLARPQPNVWGKDAVTGIDKRPVTAPVLVRAPGDKAHGLGSGLSGDSIGDRVNHGGDDQAVYAYAREDLDDWQTRLGRQLPAGSFGENLTTTGIDVSGALIGEQWRIGDDCELQVTCPRIPCST